MHKVFNWKCKGDRQTDGHVTVIAVKASCRQLSVYLCCTLWLSVRLWCNRGVSVVGWIVRYCSSSYEGCNKRSCKRKSNSNKKVNLITKSWLTKWIYAKYLNLISNLKAGVLPTDTLLLHPVLEVHILRRDYIQLPLISLRMCTQYTVFGK